jgi:tetratricopeptide (TPR) repeat protein
MALYEAGDTDGAITAARSSGNNGLANRIASFKKELSSARADLAGKDGAGAVKHYTAALAIDDELSKGWGKLGGQIRVELSKLYEMAGLQSLEKGDHARAASSFEKALKFAPESEKLKALLQKARNGGGGAAPESEKDKPAADPRSAADQAFGQ